LVSTSPSALITMPVPAAARAARGAEGGHRPGDQEYGEQADPDPGLGLVVGPAQRVAVQPERAGQPRAARGRPGIVCIAQPLM
jgi:hypothetical protein